MYIDELRDYCLSKPNVTESTPFGPENLVFKIHGKIFLITDFHSSPLQFNVKCNPEKAIELREKYNFVLPGYHMNKKHWNTIICENNINDTLLRKWIDHSYDLVFSSLPKKFKDSVK